MFAGTAVGRCRSSTTVLTGAMKTSTVVWSIGDGFVGSQLGGIGGHSLTSAMSFGETGQRIAETVSSKYMVVCF